MWRKELKDGVTDFSFSNISPYRTKSVLAGTQDGNLARGISCFKYQSPVSMTNRVLECTHKMWFKGSKLCHALGNAFLQYVAVLLVLTWRWSWSGALLAGLLAGRPASRWPREAMPDAEKGCKAWAVLHPPARSQGRAVPAPALLSGLPLYLVALKWLLNSRWGAEAPSMWED